MCHVQTGDGASVAQDEGMFLLRLMRRGRADRVRYRRALIVLASSSGTPVAAIARSVAAHPDTVRDVIHAFNADGLAALDSHWGGGRPRRITSADETFVVAVAKKRPRTLGSYLRWRNVNARGPRVLDAPRRERARVRSGNGLHWDRPQPRAA